MNEWLELAALTDLMEKENAVLSTIEAARNAGYEFAPDCGLALLRHKHSSPANSTLKI